MDLAEFLLARIAEDEDELDRAAEAEAEALRHDGMPGTTAAEIRNYWLNVVPDATRWPRVLAECEAKRRIVEHQQEWARTLTEGSGRYTDDQCTMYRMAMFWVLERLAEPYTDHPDA